MFLGISLVLFLYSNECRIIRHSAGGGKTNKQKNTRAFLSGHLGFQPNDKGKQISLKKCVFWIERRDRWKTLISTLCCFFSISIILKVFGNGWKTLDLAYICSFFSSASRSQVGVNHEAMLSFPICHRSATPKAGVYNRGFTHDNSNLIRARTLWSADVTDKLLVQSVNKRWRRFIKR